MRPSSGRSTAILVAAAVIVVVACPAWAQAHNPFGVGISEGGGSASGPIGWMLQQQTLFERQLSSAVRAARTDGSAVWLLTGLSFAYGVFHAAGPGHGKAVMASYLFASDRALKRALVLSLCAALLQGLVAVLLVGVLALVLHATAQRMKDAASLVESLSYAGIAVLGAWLVWQKGRRFVGALIARPAPVSSAQASAEAFDHPRDRGHVHDHVRRHDHIHPDHALHHPDGGDEKGGVAVLSRAAEAHRHGPDCKHYHAPDPAALGEGFSWREALLTVVAAGSRPCSGAILVLVFALAQGLFLTGMVAVLAMSIGTAVTTGALASLAVLAKGAAVRFAAPETRRGTLVVRGLELLAATVILAAGLSLFLGYTALGGA